MEFSTLTRRVAEYSGIDAAEIEPDTGTSAGERLFAALKASGPPSAGDLFGTRPLRRPRRRLRRPAGQRPTATPRSSASGRSPPRAPKRCASCRSIATNTRPSARLERLQGAGSRARRRRRPLRHRSRGAVDRSDAGRTVRHRAGARAERCLLRPARPQAGRRRRRPVRRRPRARPDQGRATRSRR